ncbi:trypsin-like serine protease [Methylopila sp. M107]|uniref:trypsin-like serine protease n=1 Tax=Methylopila sp. M107 TaxID=1101190 RepID=UPI000381CD13|nr:trypsin-like serine protease [Methylopila sp. M107]
MRSLLRPRDSRSRLGACLGVFALIGLQAPAARADEGAATVSVQAVQPTGDGKARVSECSGALIAPDIVLTAGHCLDIAATPAHVAVFAYRDGKPLPQPLPVAAFARHPGHVVGWRDRPGDPETRQREIAADLALIRLKAPVAGAAPIGFAAFASPDGSIAGTGADRAGGRSGALKRARLSAARASTGDGARVVFATASATVCGGDSGGPATANGAVWGVVAAVLRPKGGCGGRVAIAPVDPDSAGFRAMRGGIGAK